MHSFNGNPATSAAGPATSSLFVEERTLALEKFKYVLES
jgi:hypothetical protein